MSVQQEPLRYHRNGSSGTLALSGRLDIFCAEKLHLLACRALSDKKAETVVVQMGQVDHIDLSTAQILYALKRDIQESSRTFLVKDFTSDNSERLCRVGIALEPENETA